MTLHAIILKLVSLKCLHKQVKRIDIIEDDLKIEYYISLNETRNTIRELDHQLFVDMLMDVDKVCIYENRYANLHVLRIKSNPDGKLLVNTKIRNCLNNLEHWRQVTKNNKLKEIVHEC